MTDNRSLLKLMPEQREDLQRWAQSRTLPAGDVFRARLILALADGSTYREIARSLRTCVFGQPAKPGAKAGSNQDSRTMNASCAGVLRKKEIHVISDAVAEVMADGTDTI